MATANIAETKVVPVVTTLKPFYDDFDEAKNFHRILFRPGYAVQARELTQLQTIMQNQVERFGNHIFQNGSIVLGGGISLDSTATYINLQTSYANTSIIAAELSANTITHSSGNGYVRAYVFGTKEATTTEPPVAIVKYLTGNEFQASANIVSASGTGAFVATSSPSGKATVASVNDGIFFINGYFVKVPAQTVVVDKYSTQANAKIGLEFSEEIVNDTQDTTLLDPAQEASNYQAPGASRLKINFDLAVRSLSSEDDSQFIELLRVENGIIKKQIQYPTYSALGDTMARRTFDESGNYTVRQFNIGVNEHPTDNTKLQLSISPGKAYIKGYEYENIAQELIDINKPRTIENVNNQDLTINFGNNLLVSNLSGYFNVATMERVDLHSIPYSFVDVASAAKYAQTKIGTARTREVKYNSSANTGDAPSFVYSISLFDTEFSNIRTNAATSLTSISANGLQIASDALNRFSSNNNAYNGATLRVISGTGIGEKTTVVAYNGITKTLNVSPSFIISPAATSNISLDFNIKMVDALAKSATYTGAADTANATVSVLSKDNGELSGNTFLTDTTFNSLVFPFPDKFIQKGSLSDQNYQYFGTLVGTFSSSAVTITIAEGEQFAGVDDSTGKSLTTLQSFAAFRANGTRLNLSSVDVTNNPSGSSTAVLTNADGYNGSAFIYFLVNANSGTAVTHKIKTEVTSSSSVYAANNTLAGTLTETLSSGTVTTYVYLTDAQVAISNPSRTPGERMSLYVSDVKRIVKIYDLNGAAIPASGASISSLSDVTSLFTFDNGQRDSHYDHASIALSPRNASVVGPLIVCFDYYRHDPNGGQTLGYFSIDSYPVYEDVPTFVDTSGNSLSLRDSIDFRPRRQDAVSTTPGFTLQGIRIPNSTTSFQTDYSYYLGKKSHVTLTTDFGQPFKIIDGTSARNPTEPRLDSNSMLLYKLTLEPYTISTANVGIQFVENKRYTMRDIGRLETRIENLEYYQSLSILEASADSMKILDENGLERTKYGILADDFVTHGYGDVENGDYLISIDRAIGGMQPAQNVVTMPLVQTSNSATRTLGAITTLAFTEEKVITQNLATKFVQVQPYMLAQWVGVMNMNPPDDNWVEVTKVPDVIVNLGSNDALLAANNLAGGTSTRARKLRANNVFVTETNWWTRNFGSRPDRTS